MEMNEEGDGDRLMGEDNTAAEGDGDRDRYCSMVRCASQSSLDESSQPERAAPAAALHAAELLQALASLRHSAALTDVTLMARAGADEVSTDEPPGEGSSDPPTAEGVTEAGEESSEGVVVSGEGCGEGIRAHRAVLAASSPYFRAMFTQFTERTSPTVLIQNLEPQALEAIVEYIYNPDSLVITEDNVQSVLAGASLLQVLGARAVCCTFLARALSPDNALGIRAFAELHACRDLAARARLYVQTHAAQVLESEEFLALEEEPLLALLQDSRLSVPGEECVLHALVRWVLHAPMSRTSSLARLLGSVRLALVPHEALISRCAAPPLVNADVRVKDLLIEALSYHLLSPERRSAARLHRMTPRAPPSPPHTLLVVGGQAPKAIRSVEALQLDSGRWSLAAELPSRRCRAGVVMRRGLLYAIGGFNGTLRVRSVEILSDGVWRSGPPLHARRSTLGVALLNDNIYCVGGFDGATGLSSAEVLESGASQWRGIASMSTRRSSVGVCALLGLLYAVGGYDGAQRQCLHTVERYDPALDAWECVESMSARRSGAGVGVLGGALYAVGGHDGPAVRRSVERYRPGVGWSAAPCMAHARRNAGVAAHAGRLYVVGGDDGQANLNTVEVFDPCTESWSVLSHTMAVGRSYAGVCVVESTS